LNEEFAFYCRESIIDGVELGDKWSLYLDQLTPITTTVYFEDIQKTVTFFYGSVIEIPEWTVEGKFNKGWKRVNEETNQVIEGYLTPSPWEELSETVTYRADTVDIENYSLIFKNGETDVIAFMISTGDTFSFERDEIRVNDNVYNISANMNYCGYQDYYGNRVVNGTEVVLFDSWNFNGQEIISGQWFGQYSSNVLYIHADWEPVQFSLTLKPNNGQQNTTMEFTYFSQVSLPILSRNGYRFDGWVDADGLEWSIMEYRAGDLTLEAQWSQLYTVTLFSRMHTICSKSYTGTWGQDIQLDTLTSGQYEVYHWGGYLPGSIYIITRDITLEAEWGYRRFSLNLYDSKNGAITYLETKTVIYNQSYNLGKRIPTSYNVFLGWYDKSTRNAADNLPQQKRYTDVNGASLAPWTDVSKSSFDLIAEYRSKEVNLFLDHSRTTTYLITDSGRFYQACDTFNIREQCGYSASKLYALGYRTIYMTVELNIWEVNDGYQYVFIYDGTGNNANLLGSIELEHGGTTKNTSSKRYAINFYVPITEDSTDIICVRYGAAGNYEDDWKNSELSLFVNACTDVMNNDPSYSIEPNV